MKEIKSFQERLDQKNAEGENQPAVNADLRTKVATLTEELKHAKWKSFTEGPQEYVFGDFMLSNVEWEMLQNTKVIYM